MPLQKRTPWNFSEMRFQVQSFVDFALANANHPRTLFKVVEDKHTSNRPVGIRNAVHRDYAFDENIEELPSAPRLAQASDVAHDSMTLSWEPPDHGVATVRKYEAYISRKGYNCERTMQFNETSNLVEGLRPKTHYM